MVTRDWHQSAQGEEMWVLTKTTLSVVTWRRPLDDPVTEWGILIAHLREIRKLPATAPRSCCFPGQFCPARTSSRRVARWRRSRGTRAEQGLRSPVRRADLCRTGSTRPERTGATSRCSVSDRTSTSSRHGWPRAMAKTPVPDIVVHRCVSPGASSLGSKGLVESVEKRHCGVEFREKLRQRGVATVPLHAWQCRRAAGVRRRRRCFHPACGSDVCRGGSGAKATRGSQTPAPPGPRFPRESGFRLFRSTRPWAPSPLMGMLIAVLPIQSGMSLLARPDVRVPGPGSQDDAAFSSAPVLTARA